jgi:hypothetical protein
MCDLSLKLSWHHQLAKYNLIWIKTFYLLTFLSSFYLIFKSQFLSWISNEHPCNHSALKNNAPSPFGPDPLNTLDWRKTRKAFITTKLLNLFQYFVLNRFLVVIQKQK